MLDEDFPPLPSRKAQTCEDAESSANTTVNARKDGVATSINDLPDELLLEILNHIQRKLHGRRQILILKKLSLVNRRMHFLVIDRLYASCVSPPGHVPYPFMRTVITNPQLGKFVQRMQLSYFFPSSKYGATVANKRTVADKRQIKDGLKAMDIPGWKAWATQCNDDDAEQEIVYATILMYTPNVAELFIDHGNLPYRIPKWLELLRWAVSGSHFGNTHQFSHLKKISVGGDKLQLCLLAPLFRLPSLRKLKLNGLIETSQSKEGKPDALRRLLPLGTCPVVDFTLDTVFMNMEELSVLMHSFRELKRFYLFLSNEQYLDSDNGEHYWSETDPDQGPPAVYFKYSSLVNILSESYLTLEDLSLGHRTARRSPPGLMGRMRQFDKITRFEAPFNALFNTKSQDHTTLPDSIPPSTTYLKISISRSYSEHRCMDALEYLVSHSRDVVPLLELVDIEVCIGPPKLKYDWKRMQELWAESDVKLVVKYGNAVEGWLEYSKMYKDDRSESESEYESEDEDSYSHHSNEGD
jgi:hypothetical protein